MTNRASEGFALVEAVVALAIVAAILGVTFQTVVMARRTIAGAEERRAAMLEARSVVSELGSTIPLAPGTTSGEADGPQWSVDIEPAGVGGGDTPLMRVEVIVSGRSHVLARLQTLRLAQ